MNLEVKQSFQEWAKSFAGCDGGNINGQYWFCGIEPGCGKGDRLDANYTPIHSFPEKLTSNGWTDQYSLKVAKIIEAERVEGSDKSLKVGELRHKSNKFLTTDSNFFKMNLYPLPFLNISPQYWKFEHFSQTGFYTKFQYLMWCQENRFEKIKKWTSVGMSKIIICTGLAYAVDFLMAFTMIKDWEKYIFNLNDFQKKLTVKNETSSIKKYYEIEIKKNNIDYIYIIPFLGQGGLMSNDSLYEIGKIIGKAGISKIQ